MIRGAVRTSTNDQKNSLEAQEKAIRAFATMKNEGVAVYVDECSGGVPLNERPNGKRLLAEMRRGDSLVVTKLDRLSRSAIDALVVAQKLETAGVPLVVLDMGGSVLDTSGPIGKLFITILAGVAEFERAMIGERTRTIFASMKQEGRWTKKTRPFGFNLRVEKDEKGREKRYLEPHPVEHEALAWMVRVNDDMTTREIADRLNMDSVLPPSGCEWDHGMVARAIAAERERRKMTPG